MGDKGGKKDKAKSKQQQAAKQKEEEQKKQDKARPRTPCRTASSSIARATTTSSG